MILNRLRRSVEIRGPGLFTSGVSHFSDAWHRPLLDQAWAKTALLALVIVLCILRAYVGLIGSRLFSHDAFMLLDGAWRMMNGQRPHINFYSHVGFLTYAPTIAGLWISGGTAWGFGYGQAFAGLTAGVWTYLLGRKRLLDVPLALMCVVAVFMATTPFCLGCPPLRLGPSTTYNRYGYVLIALILIEAFVEKTRQRQVGEFLGGVSTGAAAAVALFLKITYFAAIIFLLLSLLPCRRQTKERWTGIVIGFGLLSLLFCSYFGFDMRPMLNDLITVAGAKHVHFESYILGGIVQDAVVLLSFIFVAAFSLTANHQAKSALAIMVAGIAVSIAGFLLILGNSEQTGFPLAVFLAIIVLNAVNLRPIEKGSRPELFHASVLLLGSAFIFAPLASGALGIAFAVAQRPHIARTLMPLESPALSGFIPAGGDFVYGHFVNDGLALVREYQRAGDSVMSLDFTNPFSYGLGMKPATGGTTVLQYETTFSDHYRPSARRLFGSATLVMTPKQFSDGSLDQSIDRLYGAYLRNHFQLTGASAEWYLYRRKN